MVGVSNRYNADTIHDIGIEVQYLMFANTPTTDSDDSACSVLWSTKESDVVSNRNVGWRIPVGMNSSIINVHS